MTGLTAANFGLVDRGEIRVGALADICVFDEDKILDTASFDDPIRPAAGIDHVLVNGREPQADTLQKAKEENVALLVSTLPAFELIGRLYNMGLSGIEE